MSSAYKTSAVENTSKYGPFTKMVDVYGLKILGLGNVGGQPQVSTEFLNKTAETFKLLLDPNAAGINKKSREKALKGLTSYNVIQRVGVKAYDAYSPILDSGKISGWDEVNDKHHQTDFIWHLRSNGGTYTPSGTRQITENLEHALHTITQFALPAAFPQEMNISSKNGKASGISGDLYKALREAIANGVYDDSDYSGIDDGSDDYAQAVLREYLYCLTYAEWGFTKKYTEDKSLAPEWSDAHLTPAAIKRDNPIGHRIFEDYLSKVISKPSEARLQSIFKDGDRGVSGYQSSSGSSGGSTTNTGSSANSSSDVISGQGRKKLNGKAGATDFIFETREDFSKKNADQVLNFKGSESDRILIDPIISSSLTANSKLSFASTKSKKGLKQLALKDYDLIYFEKKGQLFLNGNGTGKGYGDSDEGGLLAILKGKPSLKATDIAFVD
jgi:hypothetical protein